MGYLCKDLLTILEYVCKFVKDIFGFLYNK